ncbi:MAG: hypothetical protein ACRER3_17570, partial [Pseudomonas fluorescens]
MTGRTTILLVASVALIVAGFVAWMILKEKPRPNDFSAVEGSATLSRAPEEDRVYDAELRASVVASKAEATFAFEDLKFHAKRGDPVAQRKLAEAYDACLAVSRSRDDYLADYKLRSMLAKNPQAAEAIVRLSNERAVQCESVDGGAVIPLAAVRGWYTQAAQNGDLAAQAVVYVMSADKPDAVEFKRYVEEVFNSNDPAAVFKFGELLPGLRFSTGFAQYDEFLA